MSGGAASMETDVEVQTQKKGASGLNISLHPLVIINISDHTTRKRSLNNNKPTRALGVLLGVQVRASRPFLRSPHSTFSRRSDSQSNCHPPKWRASPRRARARSVSSLHTDIVALAQGACALKACCNFPKISKLL